MLVMALYSLLLLTVLVVGAPYWLARMATSGRYRAGLGQRLGRVPAELRTAAAGRQVLWVHAVSVGEVLASTRLVTELEAALGFGWILVVSTTTATGQALARERFGKVNSGRVFFYPLDFAWAVRAYLRALNPKLLILMESELWPRMLVECGRRDIPVVVVNARVSDRSFARGMRIRAVWGRLLRRVTLFLAQSDEDARRLVAMGARADAVLAIGNLKYDVRSVGENAMKKLLGSLLGDARLVVAGSLLEGEEKALLKAWPAMQEDAPEAVLLLAPRHPQRFNDVVEMVRSDDCEVLRCSTLDGAKGVRISNGTVLVLDTLGDLAAVYGLADVAFVGGSLVPRGGHNPLEPAQFGVPVVMGPSYGNFRDIVEKMQDGVWDFAIVRDKVDLEAGTGRSSDRSRGRRRPWASAGARCLRHRAGLPGGRLRR